MRLSEAFRAIVSQQLLPAKDEKGRVAAVELLIATPAVRECLKDPTRMGELRKLMADGRKKLGTQTFEQHLAELTEAGTITAETAKAALAMTAGPRPTAKKAKAGRLRLSRPPMPSLDQTLERVLALAREAGTPAAAAARDLVAAHLGARVPGRRQRFAFAPAQSHGFPVFGAGLGGWPCCCSRCSGRTGARLGRCLVSLGDCCCWRCSPSGIGLGWLPLGGGAREDANLIATRGGVPVRRWIVAHLDTKAQRHSMAGRLWRCGSSAWRSRR